MTRMPLTRDILAEHVRVAHARWYSKLCAQADQISNATVLTRCEAISLLLQRPGTITAVTATILDELVVQIGEE